MTRTQISTGVSTTTRAQADRLMSEYGYTLRDIVTVAIQLLYDKVTDNNQPDSIKESLKPDG